MHDVNVNEKEFFVVRFFFVADVRILINFGGTHRHKNVERKQQVFRTFPDKDKLPDELSKSTGSSVSP